MIYQILKLWSDAFQGLIEDVRNAIMINMVGMGETAVYQFDIWPVANLHQINLTPQPSY